MTVFVTLVLVMSLRTTCALASTALTVTKEDVIFVPAPFVHQYEVIETVQLQSGDGESDAVFTLPAGYQGLQVVGVPKSDWQVSGHVLRVRRAVQANATGRVTLTYTVPQDAGQGAFVTLTSAYPVAAAHLYLPIGNSSLSAPSIQAATQTVTISGTEFRVFSRYGIAAGEQWPISLQELPAATAPVPTGGLPVIGTSDDGASNAIGAVVNLVIAVLVLGVGFVGLRTAGARRIPKSREDALLQAWSSVEQQFSSGQLEGEVYQRRRAELKRKIVALRLGEEHRID